MSPKPARVLQPPHLSVDDAWRVLVDAYDEADIQEIRDAEAIGQGGPEQERQPQCLGGADGARPSWGLLNPTATLLLE